MQAGLATLLLRSLAITHDVNGKLLQTLMDCLELGVEIIPIPVLYEQLTGRVPIEYVSSNWYVAMPIYHPLTRPFNCFLKRLFDIVSATMGLIVLAVMFPFIALAIYIESPGPIFYTQKRMGKGGNILKGEMSAVGPKPERPEFVEKLEREIPFYRVRHAVKPGMAGWALVKYGYTIT